MTRKNISFVTPLTFKIGDTEVAYVQAGASYLLNDTRVSLDKYEAKGGHNALAKDVEACVLRTLGDAMAHRPYGITNAARTTLSPVGLQQEPIIVRGRTAPAPMTWIKITTLVEANLATIFNNFDCRMEPGTFFMAQATKDQYYFYLHELEVARRPVPVVPVIPVLPAQDNTMKFLAMGIAAVLLLAIIIAVLFSPNGEPTKVVEKKKKEIVPPAPKPPVVIEKIITITEPAPVVRNEKPVVTRRADTTYHEAPMPVVKNGLLAPAFTFEVPAGKNSTER